MSDTENLGNAPLAKATKKHKYVEYEHHGEKVVVREDLKGKHRNVCLCYSCDRFKPEAPEKCKIAHALYELVVKSRIVAPVWECAEFLELGVKTSPKELKLG